MEYDVNHLNELVRNRDVKAIKSFMEKHDLILDGRSIVPKKDAAKNLKIQSDYWNQRQQAVKILLNSLYGALLNEGCLFFDKRLGQSVTLTGRSVTKHMSSALNENIMGEYTYKGGAIAYNDTDSAYFTAYNILKSNPETASLADDKDTVLELYKTVGDLVNQSFPPFMNRAFNTGIDNGSIIAAGLELVAENAIFMKKKRYAVLKFWDEDNGRLDIDGKPGKIKAVGLEIKRSDTPKYMQEFMESTLMDVLQGAAEEDMINKIRDFRFNVFRKRAPWDKGSPKKVNGLTSYMAKLGLTGKQPTGFTSKKKIMVPGHVQAAINWNKLRKLNADKYATELTDGANVVVCKLKQNVMGMTSIAFPYDDITLPEWFKSLPFDESAMEEIIVDKKMGNLLGVLKWDLTKTKISDDFADLFGF